MTGDLKTLRATRRRAMMQAMTRICVIVLSIYVGLGLLLFFGQRAFIYPGQYFGSVGTPAQEGIKGPIDLRFKTADGLELHAWYTPVRDPGKPVILFFHGNGMHIKAFYPKANFYIEQGYGAFICEYRGFGGNPGKPTEQGLYNDAEACLATLKEKASQDVVYYGESLGTGVAVNLSLKHPPKGIVLESPYSSVVDVAKNTYGWYPVDMMVDDKFDSIGKIDQIKVPVLIVHGKIDNLIPFKLGQRLFEKANRPKELHAISGGAHEDLYSFGAGDLISNWLDKLVKGDKSP